MCRTYIRTYVPDGFGNGRGFLLQLSHRCELQVHVELVDIHQCIEGPPISKVILHLTNTIWGMRIQESRFTKRPPKRGHPLYKGQLQCIMSSSVRKLTSNKNNLPYKGQLTVEI